jgi:hypothetical protein
MFWKMFLSGVVPEIKPPADRYKVSVFGAMGKNGQPFLCIEIQFSG